MLSGALTLDGALPGGVLAAVLVLQGAHVEVAVLLDPLVVDLRRHRPAQPQAAGLIWEDSHDVGAPLELLVEPLEHVGALQVLVMGSRQPAFFWAMGATGEQPLPQMSWASVLGPVDGALRVDQTTGSECLLNWANTVMATVTLPAADADQDGMDDSWEADLFDNQLGPNGSDWSTHVGDGRYNDLSVYVDATFETPIILDHFTIASSRGSRDADPVSWEIQGSNDGRTFHTIFHHTDPDASIWTARSQVIRFEAGVHYETVFMMTGGGEERGWLDSARSDRPWFYSCVTGGKITSGMAKFFSGADRSLSPSLVQRGSRRRES